MSCNRPQILLIVHITNRVDDTRKTAAYTDNLTAAGKIIQLKQWWETICNLGPRFRYYPESSKSWLVMKENPKQTGIESIQRHRNKNFIRSETMVSCSRHWII